MTQISSPGQGVANALEAACGRTVKTARAAGKKGERPFVLLMAQKAPSAASRPSSLSKDCRIQQVSGLTALRSRSFVGHQVCPWITHSVTAVAHQIRRTRQRTGCCRRGSSASGRRCAQDAASFSFKTLSESCDATHMRLLRHGFKGCAPWRRPPASRRLKRTWKETVLRPLKSSPSAPPSIGGAPTPATAPHS